MQIGFLFDQSRCSGCGVCVLACWQWHSNDVNGIGGWRRVWTTEKGDYPNIAVTSMTMSCLHCAEPPCVSACPAGAILKRAQDGIVVVDRDQCLGRDQCDGACLKACPYGIPQFGSEPDAKMEKCDLCLEKVTQGHKPICVAACPMRALDAGPMDLLKEGTEREAEGFCYLPHVQPSTVFRPKKS